MSDFDIRARISSTASPDLTALRERVTERARARLLAMLRRRAAIASARRLSRGHEPTEGRQP